jgi:hypothetical protein
MPLKQNVRLTFYLYWTPFFMSTNLTSLRTQLICFQLLFNYKILIRPIQGEDESISDGTVILQRI